VSDTKAKSSSLRIADEQTVVEQGQKIPAVYRKTIRVRFSDTDPAGVAYFPVVLDYFHVVFEDFFEEALGVPYREVLEDHGIGFPAVKVNIEYERPLHFGSDIEILHTVEAVGNSSLTCRYEVWEPGATSPAVHGTIVTVTVDLEDFATVPLPAALRRRLASRIRAEPQNH